MKLSLPLARVATSVGLALLVVAQPSAAQQPARLQHADAARLNGRAYTVEMTHALRIDAHGDIHDGERSARVRLTFVDARAEGGRVQAAARIDSVRGAAVTPHGREVMDARHLVGTAVNLSYARSGGPATYAAPIPALDFSMFGGVLPLSSLLDYLFQPLPDRAVRVGDTWEQSWVRSQLDGGAVTTRSVTSRFTVASLERRGAGTVARVNIATRAGTAQAGTNAARAGADAARAGADAAGLLESSGFFLIGVEDGLVQEVSIEETVSGPWDFGGEPLSYRQTSRVRVLAAGMQPAAPQR